MFSRILCCALCACVVSPAMGQLVIQDGDYYPRLQYTGNSILMTGGRVDEMHIYVGSFRVEGGQIGNADDGASITAPTGTFDILGGNIHAGLYCDRFTCDVNYTGYNFRSFKYVDEFNDDFYFYNIEGVLSDGSFVSMSLQADSLNGGANVYPHFTLLGTLLPGDVNGDWAVDLADLNTIRNNFGLTNAGLGDGDLTGDGSVGLGDLNEVRNTFGSGGQYTLGPEYEVRQQPVPEPSSLAITVLALFALAGTPSLRRCCSSLRQSL